MSLLLAGLGLAVALTFFAGAPARDAEAVGRPEPVAAATPKGDSPGTSVVSPEVDDALDGGPDGGPGEEPGPAPGGRPPEERRPVVEGPENKTLRLTIPAMGRIRADTIPYADGGNEAAFKRHAGVHLRGTGDPWEREANVYIAGHRLGYPGTDSFLAFWDLNKVGRGDKVYLRDAEGERYVYKVFKKFVVQPTEVSVTRPLEGRNVVTLQTCTLPDYSKRLIVQAEKVS